MLVIRKYIAYQLFGMTKTDAVNSETAAETIPRKIRLNIFSGNRTGWMYNIVTSLLITFIEICLIVR